MQVLVVDFLAPPSLKTDFACSHLVGLYFCYWIQRLREAISNISLFVFFSPCLHLSGQSFSEIDQRDGNKIIFFHKTIMTSSKSKLKSSTRYKSQIKTKYFYPGNSTGWSKSFYGTDIIPELIIVYKVDDLLLRFIRLQYLYVELPYLVEEKMSGFIWILDKQQILSLKIQAWLMKMINEKYWYQAGPCRAPRYKAFLCPPFLWLQEIDFI